MADTSRTLVLVDGSSYLYRAFHALPPLSNSRGEPTGAVYGVANMLRRLLEERRPSHVAVVFDAKGKTFRDELFEQYKAHRPPMPEELRAQIEPLHALVRALGFPILEIPGVEADDVIGTLALQAAATGMDCLISTGDKDLAQLVNERITLVNTMSNSVLDRAGVVAKFGVPPERIVDYLALVGDTSDNVPGVPKVGPKTAAKWLTEYGSLDALLARREEVAGKVGESLRANLEQLELSRRLVTIQCDVALDQGPEALVMGQPDTAALRELYTRLEFGTWLRQLGASGAPTANESAEPGESESTLVPAATAPASEAHYETVFDEAALDAWITRLEQAELIAFDTETTSLDYMRARM